MKKTLFAALALAFVASCSNEEVVEMAQKEAIAFDNAFVDNSTRSVYDPSYSNTKLFANFAVYGFVDQATLFDGTTVTGSALNGNWTYEGKQYWIASARYNFSAVAPATGWTKVEASKDGVKIDFTNTNGKSDILFAKSAEILGATSDNPTVAFTFKHILSKVKFSFKNSYNATGATIRVKDIKITNAHEKGRATLGATTTTTDEGTTTTLTTTWSNQSTENEKYTLDFGNAATASATAEEAFGFEATNGANVKESYNELLLIPGAVTDGYTVTFTVDLLMNGTPVKSYPHTATVNFTPVAGYAYNINAEINPENIDPAKQQEEIKFTVTSITDWDKTNESQNATVNTTPATGGGNVGGIGG